MLATYHGGLKLSKEFNLDAFLLYDSDVDPNIRITVAAAASGRVEVLEYLLVKNGFIAEHEHEHSLYYASINGQVEAVRILLQHRAEIDIKLRDIDNTYMDTLEKGILSTCREIILQIPELKTNCSLRGNDRLHQVCYAYPKLPNHKVVDGFRFLVTEAGFNVKEHKDIEAFLRKHDNEFHAGLEQVYRSLELR